MMRAAIQISAVAALLCACGTTPKETFYTLNPAGLPATAQSEAHYSVAIGPVKVPEMVDRPQLVVRRSPNRVEVLEQYRWAQSLRADIARVLAADLANRLHDAQVLASAESASANADYRIALDIEQFDAVPAQGVTVQAVWAVRRAGQVLQTGRSVRQEAARGDGYEELVSAYARALDALSADIGTALQSLRAARPGGSTSAMP